MTSKLQNESDILNDYAMNFAYEQDHYRDFYCPILSEYTLNGKLKTEN